MQSLQSSSANRSVKLHVAHANAIVPRCSCGHAPVIATRKQQPQGAKANRVVCAAAAGQATTASTQNQTEEFYEVNLEKPLGLKFARGRDGGAYIVKIDAKVGNIDPQMQEGDKIVNVSASFGPDVWEARNYGQVMYAIRTRAGGVYLKMKKMFGDMTMLQEEEMTEAEKMWKAEQSGGNYGAGTKEIQTRNYIAQKEAERKRRELFDDALQKFRSGKIEDALIDWENVVSLEPKNYIGDNFSRVSRIFMVTQYNVACCYAALGQLDAGLEALESALSTGFEDYDKIRKDPNLAALRESPKFKPMLDKYDEPIINENALKAIKNLFSFGKK